MPERPQIPRSRWRARFASRAALRRFGAFTAVAIPLGFGSYVTMIRMPGEARGGPLLPLEASGLALAAELRGHVEAIASLGPRNTSFPDALAAAAASIESALVATGRPVQRQTFDVAGVTCENLWIEIPGATATDEIVVVGAHYDSCRDSPGANDNGSGVAATLALARRFASGTPLQRTLRFVLFVNEEPPHFMRRDMGSLRYAERCRERGDDVTAMLSLETIGWYSSEPGSQRYPPPLGLVYPSTGDFIAFVGNLGSRRLVRACVGRFRETTAFPSEGGALPGWLPGIGWSDHWAFWKMGYDGVMVTDTAPFRYPHYHRTTDTADKVDPEGMARVVVGVGAVIEMLGDPRRYPR